MADSVWNNFIRPVKGGFNLLASLRLWKGTRGLVWEVQDFDMRRKLITGNFSCLWRRSCFKFLYQINIKLCLEYPHIRCLCFLLIIATALVLDKLDLQVHASKEYYQTVNWKAVCTDRSHVHVCITVPSPVWHMCTYICLLESVRNTTDCLG